MNGKIHEIVRRYLLSRLPRREFIRYAIAAGLSSASTRSLFAATVTGTDPDQSISNQPSARPFKGSAGAALVQQLKAIGVEYVFHTNTSGVEQVIDAVVQNDMQIILVTHEGQAVSAAHGYALASGKLGFFIGSQVGVGNSISNLYNAWKDRTPLLITFSRAQLRAQGGQDSFQEWDDHLRPTEPFSAWSWSCVAAETIPEIVRRAVKFAHAPPGAPTTLAFPYELLREEIEASIVTLAQNDLEPVYRANRSTIAKAAQMLVEARSPVFIVGPEISRNHAGQGMIDLAESLSVPVFQSDDLYCDFPTRHPLFLGDFPGRATRFPASIDLIVVLGAKLGTSMPKGIRLIHASSDPDIIGQKHSVDLPIVANVSTVIDDLSIALNESRVYQQQKNVRESRLRETSESTKLRDARRIALKAGLNNTPISWQRVGWELEQSLDRDAIIVPELGSQKNKLLGELSLGIGAKTRIGRTEGSALGWGVGAAFGVQLAFPSRQVVALQGDGGMLFGQTETLWSISRYKAPLLIIILNNHSYNETATRNVAAGGQANQLGRDLTSFLGDPDVHFAKIAEAYSINSERVSDPDKLQPALLRAIESMRIGRPYLLDIEVERDGILVDSTTHQEFSIAALGGRNGN